MKTKVKETIAITTGLTILTLAVAFTVDYTNLKAQVSVDGRDITEVKMLISGLSDKLDKYNENLSTTNDSVLILTTKLDSLIK